MGRFWGSKGVRVYPILEVAKVSVAPGQSGVTQGDKNKVCQVLHSLGGRLSDATVKGHEELQFIRSFGHLFGTLAFRLTPDSLNLWLHFLLKLEKAAIEAGRLIANHRGLSCTFLPLAQCILWDAVWSWGNGCHTRLSSNSTKIAVKLWWSGIPTWHCREITCLSGVQPVPFTLWSGWSEELVQRKVTSFCRPWRVSFYEG